MSCRSCVLEKGKGEIGCLLCPRWDRRFARSALVEVFDWGGMFFLPLALLDVRSYGDSSCSYIRGEIFQVICEGRHGELVFGSWCSCEVRVAVGGLVC